MDASAPPALLTTRGALRDWAADRDNRVAAIGLGLWVALGVGLFVAVRNSSVGVGILAGSVWLGSVALFARTAVRDLFGPVFVYETVRLGRRRLTFILRTLYLLALTFTLGMVFLEWLSSIGYWTYDFQGIRPGQLSQYGDLAFRVFAPIQFGVVCFLTPAYVAGCIADEKERKTLEFLFATDLKNREIIFGKLAARILTLLMYVVAGLPVLSSLMLFGGIDPEMLLAAYAFTVVTVLGLAALSIYCSTVLRRPRDAIVMTYLTSGAYFIATFIAPMYLTTAPRIYGPITWFGYEVPVETIGLWMGGGNPIFAIVQVFGFGATTEDVGFRYALTYGVIILLCLGFSIVRLRAIALRQSYGTVGGTGTRAKKAKARPVCGNDPIFWKEVFVEGSQRRGWSTFAGNVILALLAFCWPVLIFAHTHFDSFFHFTGFTAGNNLKYREAINVWLRVTTGFLSFLMMMGAAIRGAGAVTAERDRDTWISLISTPLSSWEMVIGKWWGAVLSVRKLGWLLVAVWSFGMVIGSVYPFILVPTIVYVFVYVAAFAWVGVFCSCTARTTLIASIRVMMAGLFLAGGFWLVLGCCCFLPMSIGRMSARDGPELVATFFLAHTPPFVAGWMPMMDFSRGDMGPFHPEERPGGGLFFVALSLFVWAGFAAFTAIASMTAFQKLANRANDGLPQPAAPAARNRVPEY
jgi:ABC-type transport system involved in multi-copper enzyme maturation permease subunit